MALDQMVVFNDYIMPTTIETLDVMINKFNQASGGAIRLNTAGFTGDFMQESFFQGIHSAQRRVDRTGTNDAVSNTELNQTQHNAVKVAGGFGPIAYEPSQMTWLNKPTSTGIEVASRSFAEALMRDQIYTALSALVAAISNNSGVTNDISGSAGVSQSALNNTHALYGDHSGNLITDVMTGSVYHKLIGQNITNEAQLFRASGVRVVDILGRMIVVIDAPVLLEAGTPNKSKILSLTDSAAVVSDSGDIISNIDTKNGKERIETTMQVDYTFNLALRGYSWDTANGGNSPSDAALQTGSNWDKSVASDKHTAGAILIADADQ